MTDDYRARLHSARTAVGLSQRSLAERIGCSDSTISQVETGQRELTASKAFAWAAACGVSLDWVAWGDQLAAEQLLALEVTG